MKGNQFVSECSPPPSLPRSSGLKNAKLKNCMKKAKVKDDGIGIAAMPLIRLVISGHKPRRYTTIAPHKLRARLTKLRARLTKEEEREHTQMAKRFTPREWEIIKMLLSGGLKLPEACEIAKMCDAEPAWL
jgi:hypothetical protein